MFCRLTIVLLKSVSADTVIAVSTAKKPMRSSEKNSYHIGDIQPVMNFVNGAIKYTTISPATPKPTEYGKHTLPFILSGMLL